MMDTMPRCPKCDKETIKRYKGMSIIGNEGAGFDWAYWCGDCDWYHGVGHDTAKMMAEMYQKEWQRLRGNG